METRIWLLNKLFRIPFEVRAVYCTDMPQCNYLWLEEFFSASLDFLL